MNKYQDKYVDYLSDESKLQGFCDYIEFPTCEEEVIDLLKSNNKENSIITVQGGRTGIVGGSVPHGGLLINLSKMDKIFTIDDDILSVMPGVPLFAINEFVNREKKGYFFPVDCTEKTASIGGIFSTGARGPRNYSLGDSIKYFAGIEVIDFDGRKHIISTEDEKIYNYYKKEGKAGVVTQLRLKLLKKAEHIWGIVFLFDRTEDAVGFAKDVEESKIENIMSFEYMSASAIALIQEFRYGMDKLKGVPEFEKDVHMIYTEIFSDNEEDIERSAEILMDLAANNHSDIDQALAVSTEDDLDKMANYRHAAAECCNMSIEQAKKSDNRITKLSTDISNIKDICHYVNLQTDIRYVVFGHMLDAHLHINFLPQNYHEYMEAKEIIKRVSIENYLKGATIFTENGIGKLKQYILEALKETTPSKPPYLL
ncbi:FAD-binding oxidoreductase [Vallitalea okinawensis]|uniref:FAD-binding oxidoreductase n=1 Tax=Vallitalea okinawensis TaxID=2078660 RepID=UPI000CFAD47A|nr:FAD-binding oxidoreductase [Vallitalea okinawensis]